MAVVPSNLVELNRALQYHMKVEYLYWNRKAQVETQSVTDLPVWQDHSCR